MYVCLGRMYAMHAIKCYAFALPLALPNLVAFTRSSRAFVGIKSNMTCKGRLYSSGSTFCWVTFCPVLLLFAFYCVCCFLHFIFVVAFCCACCVGVSLPTFLDSHCIYVPLCQVDGYAARL